MLSSKARKVEGKTSHIFLRLELECLIHSGDELRLSVVLPLLMLKLEIKTNRLRFVDFCLEIESFPLRQSVLVVLRFYFRRANAFFCDGCPCLFEVSMKFNTIEYSKKISRKTSYVLLFSNFVVAWSLGTSNTFQQFNQKFSIGHSTKSVIKPIENEK